MKNACCCYIFFIVIVILYLLTTILDLVPLNFSQSESYFVSLFFFICSQDLSHPCSQKPDQMYHPSVEVTRNCCRPIKKGYQRTNSPRYYISFTNGDKEDKPQSEEEHVVVQMDTESPIIYQKICLDHYFDKPLQVSVYQKACDYVKATISHIFLYDCQKFCDDMARFGLEGVSS